MFLGTIAHYEECTTVEFIAVFLAHIMPKIHDIIFVFFRFGRKCYGADSKNSFMTVTEIQKLFYFYFCIFGFQKTKCGHLALT
jgi:hypothetical protein